MFVVTSVNRCCKHVADESKCVEDADWSTQAVHQLAQRVQIIRLDFRIKRNFNQLKTDQPHMHTFVTDMTLQHCIACKTWKVVDRIWTTSWSH